MKSYFILWEQVSAEDLVDCDPDSIHFFAIEHQGQLEYLGLAYKLSLEKEVNETIKLFRLEPSNIKIWTGFIVQNIHNMVNQQIAEEILCLLVYNTKPNLNVICKRSYYGRESLELHNRGNELLPANVKADNKVMRLTGS